MLKITGYPDRYSAQPGERIEFKVSLEEGDSFEARLVRDMSYVVFRPGYEVIGENYAVALRQQSVA